MLKKLVSLLLFVLATSAFAQSPYGRVLTLDPSGTQQWIDIMTVLSDYPTYHPSTPPTVWLTSGNLLSGGEFLGSTNNQPLIFKTNSTEQMIITPTGQIGIGTTSPNPSAILDIVSNTTGILIPRLTTSQRNSISSPAQGLLIFNTSSNSFEYYDGTSWQTIITATSTVPFNLIASGTNTSANMVVGTGATFTTNDDAFTIQDNAYYTKKAKFEASGITAGMTRTYNLPDYDGTLALLEFSQTFLGTQTFNDISVTGNTTLGNANSDALTVNATSTFNAPITGTSATFNNNLTVNGNTTLGDDASTDKVTFNATVASNIVPDANATRNLGTGSSYWNYIYANGILSQSDGFRLIYYPTIQKAFFDIVDPGTNKPLVTIGPLTNTSTLENGGVAVKERTNGNLRAGIGWNGSAWAAGVGNQDNPLTPHGVQFLFNPANNPNDPRIVVLNGSTTPVFLVDKEGDLTASSVTVTGNTTFGAAVNFPVTSVSTNTTLGNTHFLVLVNATGGAVTITLPSASGNTGRMYVIMKTDASANSVTIAPTGGQFINGAASISFNTQWQKYTVMSDGSNWVAWQ
jgi:hypothetical protein